MALNPKLKEMIEKDPTMSEAYKATLIASMADASPEFQNKWMMQDDYSRRTQELETEKKTWKVNADKYYDDTKKTVSEWQDTVRKATEAREQAEARLAELTKGGIPNVPGAGLSDETKTEIAGLKTLIGTIDGKLGNVVTEEKLQKVYGNAIAFIGEQMLELDELGAQHQERFGRRFGKAEKAELVAFANTKANELQHPVSLEDAYNMKFGKDIKELERKKIAEEAIEQFKSQHMVPGGADGSACGAPSEKGPMQLRIEQERNRAAGITDAAKIGHGSWQEAAAEGGRELAAEGKY